MVLDTMYDMHDGWGWVIGAVVMLLVWGTIVWGAVYLFRRTGAAHGDTAHAYELPDAESVLRRRFADGEIDRNEYEERLAELRRSERS